MTRTINSINSGGSLYNQVELDYNGLGQQVYDYQDHGNPVRHGISLNTQYGYSVPAAGSLQVSMTYPNGRILHYGYDGSALDTAIGRLSYLADDNGLGSAGTHLQNYSYLGIATAVVIAEPETGVSLTYVKQTGDLHAISDGGDQYTGLDRFGRVIDQNWVTTSTGVSTDRFQYGYDRAGNVLYRSNLVSTSNSELYHTNSAASGDNNTAYDGLSRLASFARGTLSSSGNNGTGLDTISTASRTQSYALDAVGNWSSSTTNGTNTTRSNNAGNQIASTGGVTFTYDKNGNLTYDGQFYYAYDGWNRLKSLRYGSNYNVAGGYNYDAMGRQPTQQYPATPINIFYDKEGQPIEYRGTPFNRQLVYSPFYVNDVIIRDDASTTGNLGISGSGLGRRTYSQHDVNHDTTALLSQLGVVLERMVYDPYGTATYLTPSWGSTTEAYSWENLWQGGKLDLSFGLYHFGARDYDPMWGRWLQEDPWGYVDGSNIYQSLKSNPLTSTDASGMVRTEQEDRNILKNKIAEWKSDGWLFSVSLMQAFLSKAPVVLNQFQRYSGEISSSDEYRSAGQDYFENYVRSNHLGEGEHKVSDMDASKKPAFRIHYYSFLGYPSGDLGFALGGTSIGYKNATITLYEKRGRKGNILCMTVTAEMHSYDVYDFPSSPFRDFFDSYSAADELEHTYKYPTFAHREEWSDTFQKNGISSF